ncbi:hypothetical protein BDP27DRAFT_1422278 [Rhodocollybia butyracea]|uniref:ER membrane protein complex subunit 7 beta-sandwich domain-containing protein n=1 Tax=Rhodocollybia butyracea TaxID=206335 RepID=A0A9P5U5Q5_9AGAR|nr:hypothetical protein BDP27DRAFT_1422278 [Rhodocollybia butyracea]
MALQILQTLVLLFLGIAVDVKGRISWNDVCREYSELGRSRAVLDDEKFSGGILKDGTFIIPNVPSGTYLLSVISHDYLFDQLRIDVTESEETPTVEARPYIPGTPMNPPSTVLLTYPLKLSARQKFDYFVPRESFNIMGMLKSPMILMMIFAGGMVLGMPYLMKNMGPESLEELRKEQAKMSHAQSALQNGDFRSGMSALMEAVSGQDQPSSQPSPQAPRTQPATKSRGKGKRR